MPSSSSSSPWLKWRTLLCALLVCCISTSRPGNGLKVEGIWSPSTSPLKVVARFGIEKSNPNHHEDTDGYAFGNFSILNDMTSSANQETRDHTRDDNPYHNAVMLFVNRTLFKQIYLIHTQLQAKNAQTSLSTTPHNNKSTHQYNSQNSFCNHVFHLLKDKFYDPKCSNKSTKSFDFVRYVPCPKDKPCNDPSSQVHILPNSQFTYVVDNQKEPTFWFLLLLACQRKISQDVHINATLNKCSWTSSASTKSIIGYDIWLVNGHPSSAENKLIDFDHQFSLEQQGLFSYFILLIIFVCFLLIQLYAISTEKIRTVNCLFTISLSLHCLSYFFICCHMVVFAHNGRGFETLHTIADIMKIMSTALFILFVLMIAKGWPISKTELFSRTMLLTIWLSYTLIKILLFIWIKGSLNYIEEVDEYHTLPGWISLGFRIILMFWFLHELRHTMILEQDPKKLKFYLHFGAGMLVWFVHLPLVAMVAMQIDLMWRYKLISGFSFAADVLAYGIVTRLMLQTRQNQFLVHELEIDEEPEYYDSINNSETYKFSKANYRAKHSYDNSSCDINVIKA